jgi:L-iditol 2-dehydrogenase
MARKGGLVNLFGGPPAGTSAAFDTNLIHYSDLTLKASFHHTPATVRSAFDLLRSGSFHCDDFLTGSASLAELPEVFHRMLTRPAEGVAPEIKTAIFPTRGAEEQSSATKPMHEVNDELMAKEHA